MNDGDSRAQKNIKHSSCVNRISIILFEPCSTYKMWHIEYKLYITYILYNILYATYT